MIPFHTPEKCDVETKNVAYPLDCLLVFDYGTIYSLSQGKTVRSPAEVGGGRLDIWEGGVSRGGGGGPIPNSRGVWGFEVEETRLSQ